MTPEGEVKRKLKKWLAERGAYAFWPVQTGRGQRTVDVLVCLAGHFLAIEAKALGKKPTALQRKTLNDVRAAGGEVAVVTLGENGELLWSGADNIPWEAWNVL